MTAQDQRGTAPATAAASAAAAAAAAAASTPASAPATLRARWTRQLTRDKSDTLLLLLAALLVLAPHFAHLPLWISAAAGATLLWRATLTLRGKRLPPLWLLLPVSLLAMAGVYHSFHTLLGRDAGVAMLALLLAFKLLEMHARRDLFVVVFLSFFLLLTNFFYSQSIPTGAEMVLTIVVLLTAQLTFQYTGAVPPLRRRLAAAARIVAYSAPLALLLFFGFPRIQGPLWGMPGDAHSGHTGMSDTMAPGTMSSLARSDEVAFRVRFIDPEPPQEQLYWRGIVLGDYDGRTWHRIGPQPRARGTPPATVGITVSGKPVRHEVTVEPSNQRWLFALEMTDPGLALPGYALRNSTELELSTNEPIAARLRYEASAYPEFRIQADADPAQMQPWLQLPAGFNPRTLALARQMRRPGAAASALAVLQMFHGGPYAYTLDPPLAGRDTVDDFLFNSKAGFCEHYAGAFVVLMRAMGVPARVVTGYQGGELNPVDGYVTVRQSDAHAWGEVWIAGHGWQRYDPTAAVAPERVRHNLARALPQQSPFGIARLGELINFENDATSWLAQLRFRINAVNNGWNQWILDYNPDRQRSFLEELSSAYANWRTAAGALAIAALLMLARTLRARSGRAGDPADAAYAAFCRQQARHGVVRAAGEGPHSYAVRLRAMAASEEKKAAMTQFLTLYGALKYGRAAPGARAATLRALTTLLRDTR
ncbi:DUF3488 and transglutaminase-like domain-containing protein [Rugamonas sp.]|uniref:transglutaminase family protein n=1 Tax=Rugamonas sp. TaxID=1926287 RepID=UPI0025E91C79|nr:DUF3488 and transglutaminase-like domain-containing protein [Rugamonas sp.]